MSVNPSVKPIRSAARPRRGFGSHVVRLADLVLARAKAALMPFGLTPLAYDTMICILDGKGISQQQLSQQLNMYAPKMVGLIDDLEKRGLVERKVSPTDRRRYMLHLTPKAHKLMQRAVTVAVALEQELFGALPEQDKARFESLVEHLEANASTSH